VGYDRLLLTAGSVNKLLPIPGVAVTRLAGRQVEILRTLAAPA